MRLKKRYFLLPFLAIFFGYMLFTIYDEVRKKTIDEFNAQQTILAKQASKGIENFFNYYLRSLTHFSKLDDVVNFNDIGKSLMESYYLTHSDVISAMTRVNKSGRITYTVPFNKKAIGADISYQKHMKTIILKQQPVISDVFKAVQGYQAVAYHVPVFSNDIFQGTIAILIPFDNLAKEYIENIKLGKSGYAWVISAGGIELYNPGSNQIGKTIFDTYGLSPSMTRMIKEMMKERGGITTYSYDRVKGKRVERIKKHAVYLPIRLGNTFWSIVVATPGQEVFSTMTGFRNKLFLIAALLMAAGLFYSYYFISAWAILREGTKRKKIEKALLESENKFRSFAEQSFVGIYLIQDGIFKYVNPKFAEIFGYTVEDCLDNMNFSKLVLSEDLAMVEEKIRRRISGEAKSIQYIFRGVKKNGNIIYIEIFGSSMLNKGNIVATGTMLDITERKQAEEALRESEEKYRNILNNIDDGYFEVDIAGNFIFFNESMSKILGYPKDELMGMNNREYMDEENAKKVYQSFNYVYRKDKSTKAIDWKLIRKDGSECFVETTVSLIKDSNGKGIGFRGVARDITNRMQLEEQLRQIHKMESIGTLAGGIAHDFNNLLMGIQGRTSLMLTDANADSEHIEHLKGIEQYVKSATDLTKQLLGFSRGGKYEVKPTNLNDFIKKQNHMFGRMRKEITIREKYKKDLWSTEVDRGQIEQVILNLYVNAWQAMPGGGDLYTQTDNVILDESTTKPFEVNPGKYVKISITDAGVGMDQSTRERIFDPFFTTKEMGRGTGLGLASVYGIIKNHGGFINVYSEKGEGTTFNIYLPASEKEPIKEIKYTEEVAMGDATILLVDDEEMIIAVGGQLLEKLGYTVFIASSGKEAIEIYQKNKDKIDMVILDMIMPGIGGGETYDRLKEINSDIKVILASGYSINGQATEILNRGCSGFIQKPFDIKSLSQRLSEVLGKG